MSDLRKLLDIVEENSADSEPQIGDIVEIEMGDTLVETYIEDITEDGVIVKIDETALKLMIEGKKQLNEFMKMGQDIDNEEYNDEAGMADNNLETLRRAVEGIDEVIQPGTNLPEWCQEKIAVAKSMLVAVCNYMQSEEKDTTQEGMMGAALGAVAGGALTKSPGGAMTGASLGSDMQDLVSEAEYQGRKVPLGKPMAGDVKKSKVYVKGPKGNVVKVNFGDKNMRIKKNIPGRRKNFRARHNCDNPGPRWKARYWSCRAW
jgi:hypothetical protein